MYKVERYDCLHPSSAGGLRESALCGARVWYRSQVGSEDGVVSVPEDYRREPSVKWPKLGLRM